MSDKGKHQIVIPAGSTSGPFTALSDITIEYPLTEYGYNGATGITTRKTIWHDREEVELEHPDGRIESFVTTRTD